MDVSQCLVICTLIWASCVERLDSVWKQRAAVQAVRASAGLVFYDYQLVGPGVLARRAPPPVPAWLIDLTGVDFFSTPIEASLGNGGIREVGTLTQLRRLNVSCPIKDEDLIHLQTLSKLQSLDLGGCPIGDSGLKHLKTMKQLQYLGIWSTNVSDAGLRQLKPLRGLRKLNLSYTKVTDAGLESLNELTHLQYLNVKQTAVTRVGIEKLQRALPDCRIDS